MKTTKKAVLLAIMGSATVAALTLLALWLSGGQSEMAQAQGPILVALDMDPTGNSCPGGGLTDCTLGTIDGCVQTSPGAAFTFDIIVDNLPPQPAGSGQAAFDAQLIWGASVAPAEADVIDITARTAISPLVHYLQQAAGSAAILNDPQALPRLAPPYWVSVGDLGTDEPNPPWTQGTAWRGALTVSGAAAPGVYKLEINSNPLTHGVGNAVPYDECESGPGCTLQNAWLAVAPATCPDWADVAIVGQQLRAANCVDPPPSQIDVSTNTILCLRKSIRNNGPTDPVDVSISTSVSTPADCAATPDPTNPTSYTDLSSTPVTVDEKFTINCANASTHSFTFNNSIAITTPNALDGNLANNSAATPYSNAVLGTADLGVSSLAVDAPTAHPATMPFDVTVNANVTNNGPYAPVNASVTLDLALSSAPGCTKNPNNPQSDQVFSLGTGVATATWSVTCTTTGVKTFDASATAAVVTTHITDPNPGNNSRSTPPGSDSTDVTPSTDVEALGWAFPDDLPSVVGYEVVLVPGTPEGIQSTHTIVNNGGGYANPVATSDGRSVADTSACDIAPNGQSGSLSLAVGVPQQVTDGWTVTWTQTGAPPYSCALTFQSALTITQPGVTDYNPGNNAGIGTLALVRDGDGDTVVDDYGGIRDNCPDIANGDQADNESDGIGDICDPDDDNDGFTDDQETTLGSNPLNGTSTPEHSSVMQTCFDGLDNDQDGWTDGYDLGCDYDQDGIPNWIDACFAIAEDMDGYQDADGCPDTDNDMDGVCDPWAPPGQVACTGSDSCPNVAEDIDSFHDANGCPDPDNDNDGFPDTTDQCPATDWTAGPDGIADTGDEPLNQYGVPIQTKEDYDGIIDVDGCHDSPGEDWDADGLDDEVDVSPMAVSTAFSDEAMGGVTFGFLDTGGLTIEVSEEPNPAGVRIIASGSGGPATVDICGIATLDLTSGDDMVITCGSATVQVLAGTVAVTFGAFQATLPPNTTTTIVELAPGAFAVTNSPRSTASITVSGIQIPPATTESDGDADGFFTSVEQYVGTDPLDACPDYAGDDAWPLDIDIDGAVSAVGDAFNYVGRIGTTRGGPNWWQRLDLDMSGEISVTGDVFLYVGRIGEMCR